MVMGVAACAVHAMFGGHRADCARCLEAVEAERDTCRCCGAVQSDRQRIADLERWQREAVPYLKTMLASWDYGSTHGNIQRLIAEAGGGA